MPETLRSLRFPVSKSRGRRYQESPHPYRREFQRDRDRIIHSRAFRRLENKTQVFTPGLSDHFRNRLTHTIEVAQIARTVADVLELDQDLTEALALGHDIGHPPFAHAGEEALNQQMRRFGEKFDHNLHALRIIESFEQRYARFPGLNLTFEVREGILKHSSEINPGETPELEEYLPGFRPPLEAQLIDLADEVAYNTADLDDAYSAGLLAIEEICESVSQFAEIREEVIMHLPGAPVRIQFYETLRLLIDHLASGLIEGTRQAALDAGLEDCEQVRRHTVRLARFTTAARETNQVIKEFLHSKVYSSRPLVAEREHSTDMIAKLFQFYLDHLDRLPESYSDQATDQPPHRVVCDYIAGMTDGFFKRTYEDVFS